MATDKQTQPQPQTPADRNYEPPKVTVLGSLSELTLGRPGPRSDGIGPGSIIPR
jgi:hypothetical protein